MKLIPKNRASQLADTENPPIQPAPVWRRLMSLVYDSLILAAISLAYGGFHLFFQVQVLGIRLQEGEKASMGILGLIGWLALIAAFYTFFWRRGGQTLGMRAWRLKLVAEATSEEVTSERPPSLVNCLIRCIISPPLLLLGGIGLWWCIIDKYHRSAYDRLSKTRMHLLAKPQK